jgi:hypothetical protein
VCPERPLRDQRRSKPCKQKPQFRTNFTIHSGGVDLRGLTVDDVSLRGSAVITVDLRYAAIRRALRTKQIVDVGQSLWDLRNASVGSVDDDEGSWPQSARLFIDGFTSQGFGSVSVERPGESSQAPLEFKLRRKWIELDTSRPCRSHPFRQLANAHLRMGDTLQGRKALYPSCAENPAVQGGDVERGERSSPCAKIFS